MSTRGNRAGRGCPDACELAAWLDGGLVEPEKAQLAGHFAGCRKCRLALEELRELLGRPPVDPGPRCLARGKALVGAGASHLAAGVVSGRRFAPAQNN